MQSGRGIKVTNFQKVFLISSNLQKNELTLWASIFLTCSVDAELEKYVWLTVLCNAKGLEKKGIIQVTKCGWCLRSF